MGDVVGMKGATPPPQAPSEIEAAAQRLLQLSMSHYLPPNLKADLDVVVKAAICWDMFTKGNSEAQS